MKIEEKIKEIIESEMKKYDYWEVNEKENARILAPALVGLFKSYARSLVPEIRKSVDNVILAVKLGNRGTFQIEKGNGKYSLVFYEPNFAGRPWDYCDPVVVDVPLKECIEKLFQIIQQEMLRRIEEV